MNKRPPPLFGTLILLVGVLCLLSSGFLAHKAGFTGDTKTGQFGDPRTALRIEEWAFLFSYVATALIGVSLLALLRLRFIMRALVAAIFVVLFYPLLWLFLLWLEEQGVVHG
jgi:hypothetical protein